MYKIKRNSQEFDIVNTIDGNDIYNSEFIFKLDNIPYKYIYPYLYNKGRLDIVSREVYPEKAYYSIPAIYNRSILNSDTIIKGMQFPSQNSIDNLLNS